MAGLWLLGGGGCWGRVGDNEAFSSPLTLRARAELWVLGVRGSQALGHLVIIQAVEPEEDGRSGAAPRKP